MHIIIYFIYNGNNNNIIIEINLYTLKVEKNYTIISCFEMHKYFFRNHILLIL